MRTDYVEIGEDNTKDSENYGKPVSVLTESIRTFEYVPNNTSSFLITLERKSGEFVSLEVYYDIIKNFMLTKSFNPSLELVLNVSEMG